MALEAAALLIQAANSGRPAATLTKFFLEDLGACYASLAILLPNSTTFALLGNLSSYGRCDMVLLRNNQTIGQYLGQEQCAVDMQHACGEGKQAAEGNIQRAWDGGARSTLVCVPLPPFIPGSSARGILSVGWSLPTEMSQLERRMTKIGEMTDALAKMSANPSFQQPAVPAYPPAANSQAQAHLPASFPIRSDPEDSASACDVNVPLHDFSSSCASSCDFSQSDTEMTDLGPTTVSAGDSETEVSQSETELTDTCTPSAARRGSLGASETSTSALNASRHRDPTGSHVDASTPKAAGFSGSGTEAGRRNGVTVTRHGEAARCEKQRGDVPFAAVQAVLRKHGRDCQHRRGSSSSASMKKRLRTLAKARIVKPPLLQPHLLKAGPILPSKKKGLSVPTSLLLLACCGLLASPVMQLLLKKGGPCT